MCISKKDRIKCKKKKWTIEWGFEFFFVVVDSVVLRFMSHSIFWVYMIACAVIEIIKFFMQCSIIYTIKVEYTR